MRKTTLLFLHRPLEKQILLAMKKRGFGEGKWNGVGGKLKDGEDILDALIREANEEISVTLSPGDLLHVATIDFYFDGKPEFNQQVHAYLAEKWAGEPQESEEMRPEWHDYESIPFESMWIDDPHWLPRVLAGEKLNATFTFDPTGASILKMEVNSI